MYWRNFVFKRYNSQLLQPLKVSPSSVHSISFTKPAIKRLSALAQMGDSLKIKVSSGGCHGYQYDLHLIKLSEQLKTMKTPEIDEEKLIFFELPFIKPSLEDLHSLTKSFNDVKVSIEKNAVPDPKLVENAAVPEVIVSIDDLSLELLDKTSLDFKQELIGSQFKIIGGNMKSSWGCGSSFDI